MMGAGKSSVGRSLHRRTGMAFLETDEIVASNFGMSIPQIFSNIGEKKFRKAETEALQTISKTETGNHRHRRRDSIAQRKCRNFKAPGSDRVARRRRGSAFCKSLPKNRSAIAANEKPERGVLANLLCAQASVRTNCGYPPRYVAAYS